MRELDFCVNTPEVPYFLSLASTCRNIKHLYLRGLEEYSAHSEAVSVRNAIEEISCLKLLAHDGVFPWFTIADVIHILSNCLRLYSLSMRLTDRGSDEGFEYRSLEFPQLRELRFVSFTTYMQFRGSFTSSCTAPSDLIARSAISFPNLTSFNAFDYLRRYSLIAAEEVLNVLGAEAYAPVTTL